MDGAIDTDVLHKASVYGLFEQLLESIPIPIESYCVLASTKFVIKKRIKRLTYNKSEDQIIDALSRYLSQIKELEPTEEEILLASQLEFVAQQLNVSFDVGESQLCAMVTFRNMGCLITGDKRAIIAAELLLHSRLDIRSLESKFICLEQNFLWLLENHDPQEVRIAVCGEQTMDRALTICFSCSSPDVREKAWREGLNSYIQDLQSKAPTAVFKTS